MKFQFGIRRLFLIMSVTCICLAIATQVPSQWLAMVVLAILISNVLGMAVALLLTHVAGFPTDGGYRNPDIRKTKGAPPKPSETSD